jgi:hypothetical protein
MQKENDEAASLQTSRMLTYADVCGRMLTYAAASAKNISVHLIKALVKLGANLSATDAQVLQALQA